MCRAPLQLSHHLENHLGRRHASVLILPNELWTTNKMDCILDFTDCENRARGNTFNVVDLSCHNLI